MVAGQRHDRAGVRRGVDFLREAEVRPQFQMSSSLKTGGDVRELESVRVVPVPLVDPEELFSSVNCTEHRSREAAKAGAGSSEEYAARATKGASARPEMNKA